MAWSCVCSPSMKRSGFSSPDAPLRYTITLGGYSTLTNISCLNSSTPMARVEESRGGHVSESIVRKDDDLVARVGFDRIDVPDLRIHIKAVVELYVRLVPLDKPLRLGDGPIGWSIFSAFEYGGGPEIVVLKNDFIEIGIHGNRTVDWIPIRD